MLINLIFSNNFGLSFSRNVSFIKNVVFVFALSFIFKNKKNFDLILKIYLIITSIVVFDILFEYFNKKNILGFESYDPSRIASFLGKELKIGNFFLGFGLISTGYYFDKYLNRSINFKILGFILITIFFIALLLTGERANAIKGIIALFLFTLLVKKNILQYKKIFFIATLIFIFSIYFFSKNIKNRFDAIIIPIKEIGIIEAFKETQHGAHYYTAIKILENYPFFGVGNKNFREECQKSEYENKSYKKSAQRCSTHPHQIYLEFLSEHGLIGAAIIVGVIFLTLNLSIKNYLKNRNLIHLAAILFIFVQFLPLIPSGSFFTSWGSTIFWLNFSILIFYNNQINIKSLKNK